MSYISYINQLWRAVAKETMPASEIALYAYLANECNLNYWRMPVACSSVRICETLRFSKQTLCTARKHLAERGLIVYIEGKSRHVPTKYALRLLTDDLTVKLTDDLTLIKDKDKDSFNRERKIFNNEQNGNRNERIRQNQRRGISEMPASPEDYEGAF